MFRCRKENVKGYKEEEFKVVNKEEAGETKQVAVPVLDAKHITCGAQSTYVSRQKDEDGNNTGFYVVRKK